MDHQMAPEGEFEFFTFFLGLSADELISLEALINSFPYSDTHKLNVVDKSEAVRRETMSGDFHFDERHRFIEARSDVDYNKRDALFDRHADRVNRLLEDTSTSHSEGINRVLRDYSSSRFCVIMDSDVEFINDNYLPDIRTICADFENDELAAIGEIYQESPLHLPLNRNIPPEFYKLLVRDRRIGWLQALKGAVRFYLNGDKRTSGQKKHKLPRLFCGLLTVNRELFVRSEMLFKSMYLTVHDIVGNSRIEHRVMGDSGASFFFQCALAGKTVVNIDYRKYVVHERSASFRRKDLKGRNWLTDVR